MEKANNENIGKPIKSDSIIIGAIIFLILFSVILIFLMNFEFGKNFERLIKAMPLNLLKYGLKY